MELLTTRIDLDAIAHNTRLIADLVAPAELIAVVKADGYNHGATQVARVMLASGASMLGVATLAEARALRDAGITAPILAWLWTTEQDFAGAVRAGIELAVTNPGQVRALIDAHLPATVTVKVETGMHRNGVDLADLDDVLTALRDAPHLQVAGLMSHLACADEPDHPATDAQAAVFRAAVDRARDLGLAVPRNHLANSPAVLGRPDLRFDAVRPGLVLYGLEPIAGREHGLIPAMTWAARVVNVKPVAAGEATSYGFTWRAPRDGYLATVPAGYADGLPRAFQDHLEVTIGGRRYPQVGRVCMDQFVIDLGANEHAVAPGDEVLIFGRPGEAMTATELAERAGTINYEVVCRPTGRTVRTFTGQAAGQQA